MNCRIITIILALCASLAASAQGKMYTRRALLEDFPDKTTKVISSGSSMLEVAFREELKSRWRLSPYEFCDLSEYEEIQHSNDFYFLFIASEGGVSFLCLQKGGREDESDNLHKPFEVIRIPIANSDDPSGRELIFLGAFVEVLQSFVEDAMKAETSAYIGLSSYNSRSLEGRTLYLNSDEPEALYLEKIPNSLIGLCISPSEPSADANCYKMLLSADTNELFYFRRSAYKSQSDCQFSPREIKKFTKRNAILP